MKWDQVLGAFLGSVLAVLFLYAVDRLILRRMRLRQLHQGLRAQPRQGAKGGPEPLPGNQNGPILGSTRFSQTFRPPRGTGQQKPRRQA